MFKVCIDEFSGTNIDNLALLLEGCGRFLLRNDETKQRFGTMLELMKRKQSLLHIDQRQTMLLENAYYQVCGAHSVGIGTHHRLGQST
jgi:regulator of nonsense transcripts 2